jgi:hypothetical protein
MLPAATTTISLCDGINRGQVGDEQKSSALHDGFSHKEIQDVRSW